MTDSEQGQHRWRFFLSGGFDQVRLDTGEDLLNLKNLDQKLWAALSCPTSGLEFDPLTLELIDTDEDGRIRAPELLSAVEWALSYLKDPATLIQGSAALPLANIKDDTEEGRKMAALARRILTNLGKCDATEIAVEDTNEAERLFALTPFNGDGIVTREAAQDPAVAVAIDEIVALLGGEADKSGLLGVSTGKLEEFFGLAQMWREWWEKGHSSPDELMPLGEDTLSALALYETLRPKLEDYFTRCQLAAFDPKAKPLLNRPEADYLALSVGQLTKTDETLTGFPLAEIHPGKPLPLFEGLNPAWAARVAEFREKVLSRLLPGAKELSEEGLQKVDVALSGALGWLKEKPDARIETLGVERIKELLDSGVKERIEELIAKDLLFEHEADEIHKVTRLLRYNRDLYTLLNNFINLRNFYTRIEKAVFQAGTLYLDGRSLDLCIKVDDVATHATLATLSRTYLVYCFCKRKGSSETMHIAAGFTDGDSDRLMVGRNGIFYDRKGQDWDATIVKIIEHPISIRQAFLAPYKRIARMIGEQVEKMAAARDKAVNDRASAGIGEAAKAVDGAKPPPPQPFDVAKFAGIFAAIGLAIGAIGTALASIVTGFISLTWWKIPIALMGVIAVISTPSVVIAWLKLRQRSLAPILDANGWAVNMRAILNIPFGRALTSVAKLPPGSERSLRDPYGPKKHPVLFTSLFLGGLALAYLIWRHQLVTAWLER